MSVRAWGQVVVQGSMPVEDPVIVGTLWADTSTERLKQCTSLSPYTFVTIGGTGFSSGGDVVGPASATDGHVARFNGTTGKLLKDSGLIVDADVDGAAAITWSKVSKIGSSLADLVTRSATALNTGTLAPAQGGTGAAAFTTGSVPYVGAAGVYAQDNANLFYDAANARLGLGTALPGTKLTINRNPDGIEAPDFAHDIHINTGNTGGGGIALDGFASQPSITMRRANGSQGTKTGLVANDIIFNFRALGYTSAGAYSAAPRGVIRAVATETWSDTAQGLAWVFQTTASGTVTTSEKLRIQASGGLSIGTTTDNGAGSVLATGSIKSKGATDGIGYDTGAGNLATQGSSKATTVAFNAVCGQITLNAAALSANTNVSFTFTNTALATGDVILWTHVSGGTLGAYAVNAICGTGTATVTVRNITGGSLSEAPVFKFVVIKAVTA